MNIRLKLILLTLLILPAIVQAQLNDAGFITDISLSKPIGEQFNLQLNQELRGNDRFSLLDRSLTGITFTYKPHNFFLKTALEYDLIYQNTNQGFQFRHRINGSLSANKEINRFTFEMRTRMQATWYNTGTGDYNYNPRMVWRNKLDVSYDIFGSPLKPYLSGELMTQINGKKGFLLNSYRLVTGVKYRYSKRETINAFVRYDQEVQQANPQNILYIGAGWNYRL